MQQTYRIFLASSYELKADREQFEIFIARQNNLLKEKGVYLQVVLWEDIGAEVYPTHKQDHYNKELKTCDIFVMLYWSKVGKYTNIEFERALGQFRFTEHNPKMYVFEKKASPPATQTDADKESLATFGKKLTEDGIFSVQYNDSSDLTGKFKNELDKLFKDGYLTEGSNKYANPAELLYTDGNSVPSGFIGRDSELKTIKEKLDKGGSLMLINAEGGIGKTSLAAKYWDESLYDYKYNAWLFCETGIIPALKKLAPKLKVDLAGLNEEQQTEAMKQALMPIANDTLLVLDNANKAEDINDFIKIFRGLGWHVLLTSRCHGVLEKAQELHIEHLPPQQAKELFESNYKEDTPEFDALLDRLLAAIGYHTLLTEIFSKNLAELKGTGETLAKFLNDLETKGLFLEERSFNIKTDYTLNVHKDADHTDAIIEILYDFKALEEQERYYLVNLALLPAVNYELKFLVRLFAPVTMINLKKELDSLFQKGWLGYAGETYRISPVIQRLVLQRNEQLLEHDCKRLLGNLSKLLETDGSYLINLNYTQAAPFAQLISSINKNFPDNMFKSLGLLNDCCCIYYLSVGDLIEAKKAAEKFEEISMAVANNIDLSIAYSRLGNISSAFGDLENALNYYRKSNKLSLKLCKDFPLNTNLKNGLAVSCEKLGSIYSDLGDLETALDFYQRYNKLSVQLHEQHPEVAIFKNGVAISSYKLGTTYFNLGDHEKALIFFQKDMELVKQLNDDYPNNIGFKNNLATAYNKLGDSNAYLGNLEMAADLYQKANEISQILYQKYVSNTNFKSALAISYERLGNMNVGLGNLEMAFSFYKKENILFEELYREHSESVNFKYGLAISYHKLGRTSLALGDVDGALNFYLQFNYFQKQLYDEHVNNVNFKNALAVSYIGLGTVYERKNKIKMSREQLEISLSLLEELVETSPKMVDYQKSFSIVKAKLNQL